MDRLVLVQAVGALDPQWNNTNTPHANVTSDANRALARRLASASAVLLQNDDGALPLSASASIAVIGSAAMDGTIFGGGGSGTVVPVASPSLYVRPMPPKRRYCAPPRNNEHERRGLVAVLACGALAGGTRCCCVVQLVDHPMVVRTSRPR